MNRGPTSRRLKQLTPPKGSPLAPCVLKNIFFSTRLTWDRLVLITFTKRKKHECYLKIYATRKEILTLLYSQQHIKKSNGSVN